jgi:crotonobetainyl-CoA:carnitine CoA-transferase CaiB-like acyl-CoA transferase
MTKTDQALSGLRIVDFTHRVAGPYATKLLADFGAEVVKIERPGGDPARAASPGLFTFLNTNKRSVVLDLKSATGFDVARELIARADVVIDNFRPGTLDQLGLGYEALHGDFPRVVYTSITNFGTSGPYRDFAATELTLDAMGGWMLGIGRPDREPVRPPGSQAQMIAGIFAATATLVALAVRDRIGIGQQVDVSIQEAVLTTLMNITTTYEYSGEEWHRDGGRSPTNHPQALFDCKDGQVGANVLYYVEWDRFAEYVDHPEWLTDPRYATPFERAQHSAAMDEVLVPWFLERTKSEIYHSAQRQKIPFASVNSPADLLDWPQLQARDYWVETAPGSGTRMPGAPFKLSDGGWRLRRPAPELGEYQDQLLDELGYDADARVRLWQSGVVA